MAPKLEAMLCPQFTESDGDSANKEQSADSRDGDNKDDSRGDNRDDNKDDRDKQGADLQR